MSDFIHLHVHTEYSVLDGLSNIKKLIAKAKALEMPAVAITDHGNMYGVLTFYNEAKKAGIKPVLGCEAYIAEGSRFDKDATRSERVRGFHCVLLAKNFTGYKNLCKLISMGFRDGFYYNPRIDKEILEQYSDGLIVSSACLAGEIPYFIRSNNVGKAEEAIQWFKRVFKDDFYLELMDHGIPDQKLVNATLYELSKKYDIKLIATNDVHYIEADDRIAHDILICINTGADYDSKDRLRYTGQEYFKTEDEMLDIFSEHPEAVHNTLEIADKVEVYSITKEHVILPVFPLPEPYTDENEYLRALTFDGAKKKYGELTEEINKRLEYELSVIKGMGFPGYFLIVQDFINKTRDLGVLVGPGRGSAAGSAVAFAIGITDIDPVKYNLLFERFLNPERVSMPDIDVDFDDEGRERVLDYVVDKYGADHVAQIVTFGTMATKLAIRDVGRVLKMTIPEVDRLCKMIPDRAKNLAEAIKQSPELSTELESGTELVKKTLHYAMELEGSVRQTGVHACGVIIGPEDLTNHIPLATAKDSKIMVTQYEGSQVESAGMLKMDFLGLKTLSILRDAINNIYLRSGETVNLDNISLEDELTFKLFKEGNTVGVFQFESAGMSKYLKDLSPENIEDLIAMNALYRPGPMNYIPLFIDRKQGRQPIEYPHPCLENVLKATYGIMVYQEQIMQTAQVCAGFTLGRADVLRRAMGKKKKDVMAAMKSEFVEGAVKNNIDEKKATEIFEIMEKFAEYGFNRSHAAAYSILAYQTAYLKAHYPAEYMASVLTHNLNNIKKISFFIEECQRMGIKIVGPNINESNVHFSVNKAGDIVFGLAGIKGVGWAAVDEIVAERKKNGNYKDVMDFVTRVNLRTVNRKSIESLATTGAFDTFPNIHRAQFLYKDKETGPSFIETIMKYAVDAKTRKEASQMSLFGEEQQDEAMSLKFPVCEEFSLFQKLRYEKDNIGFYLSGYPTDQYKLAVKCFTKNTISQVKNYMEKGALKTNLSFAAMVVDSVKCYTKTNREYGRFTFEDQDTSLPMILFSEEYLKYQNFLNNGELLYVTGSIVSKQWKDSNELIFSISNLMLLENVLPKMTNKVTLVVDYKDITRHFVDQLSTDIKSCKGQCPLMIEIIDQEDKCNVETKMSEGGIEIDSFVNICKTKGYKFIIK